VRPTEDTEREEDSSATEYYQMEMMRSLREVNVDYYTVGWYSSTHLGSIPDIDTLITEHFNYQSTIKKCVVVLYDPWKMSKGEFSLKALRLTDSFMELYSSEDFTQQSLARVKQSFSNVFEEIPIQIHNSHLVEAFLGSLESKGAWGDESLDFDRLDLSTNPFLEKNLEFLIEQADEFAAAEQKRLAAQWQANQRSKRGQKRKDGMEERPAAETNQLESLLLTNQIHNYCGQVNNFAAERVQLFYCRQFLLNKKPQK